MTERRLAVQRGLVSPAAIARRGAEDRSVRLRPLVRGEAGPVEEIFAGLGQGSREHRFLVPKDRLTGADLRQLTNVDGHDHVALVAETSDGHPVGVARFGRNADGDSADVAVAVVDHWQSKGVGTLLVSALAESAQRCGIRRFTLTIAHDNHAAFRLMRRFSGGARCLTVDRYAAHVAVSLAELAAEPRRPA